VVPGVDPVVMVIHADTNILPGYSRSFEDAARKLGVTPIVAPVRDRAGIERALDEVARGANGGVLVPPEVFVIDANDPKPTWARLKSRSATGLLP
jgi:hypothetical protein